VASLEAARCGYKKGTMACGSALCCWDRSEKGTGNRQWFCDLRKESRWPESGDVKMVWGVMWVGGDSDAGANYET